MFILNQNHSILINFNKVEEICIHTSSKNEYYIEYADYKILGFYKSKEKAEEVFEDICDWVSNYEKMKYSRIGCYSTLNIYKMQQDDETE